MQNSNKLNIESYSIKFTKNLLAYFTCILFVILGLLSHIDRVHASTIDAPTDYLSLNAGLVGWWTFDGKSLSSTTATDMSGNGNNGTLVNNPTPTIGKIGQALFLNGPTHTSNVDISVADSSSLNFNGSDVTFSLWIKPVVNNWAPNYTSILAKRALNQNEYELDLQNNTGFLGFFNGSIFTTTYAPPLNVWTQITLTIQGSTCTFYANGNVVGTESSCIVGTANTSPLIICYYDGGSSDQQQFYGSIDDVRIYNRALSASEVNELYMLNR